MTVSCVLIAAMIVILLTKLSLKFDKAYETWLPWPFAHHRIRMCV